MKWTLASDRVEFALRDGDEQIYFCKACGHEDKYHVDSFTAAPNKLIQVVASIVFLIGTPIGIYLLWDIIWAMTYSYAILGVAASGLIPIAIYMLLLRDDRRRVSAFNNHKLKGYNARFK